MAIGFMLMAIGLFVGDLPVKWMVTSESGGALTELELLTQSYAWDYMRIMLIGLGGLGAQFTAVSVFNSLGRTMYPMWMLYIG